ncbi:uncharacterized protein N0V89_011646 [Didymosphaeria variabile]|uniref:F-box domain-containing protein n=1 Tax=Didymosphaeria variabile TaxID=1932322 RepID=A0A9W9C6L1_9PLEO|nr:uncharacterized protein N0V89_011646 [Didymosphaeria variabile]KAJ4345513.1 hypothetical protein N0V89_011646 [Didymosphaeria variabile]
MHVRHATLALNFIIIVSALVWPSIFAMTSHKHIPVEVLLQCAQYFDIPTLKNFRLASRATATTGAEQLFHSVILRLCSVIYPTKVPNESPMHLSAVLESHKLKHLVKQVIVDARHGVHYEERQEDPTDGDIWNGYTNDFLPTPWAEALCNMYRFPSLKEVDFAFNEHCGIHMDDEFQQDVVYRGHYQRLLFATLSKAAGCDSLSIRNMQDALIANADATKEVGAVKERLKKLGIWPFCDLRGIHFPHLNSLALGHWTIAHDWQIEWITSHGQTLQSLTLDDCPIVYALNIDAKIAAANWPHEFNSDSDIVTHNIRKYYTTRWSDVLPRLQTHLLHLKNFGMAPRPFKDEERSHKLIFETRYHLPSRIEPARYMNFEYWFKPSTPWFQHKAQGWTFRIQNEHGIMIDTNEPDEGDDRRDEEALDRFLRAIGTSDAEIARMKVLDWQPGVGWCMPSMKHTDRPKEQQ